MCVCVYACYGEKIFTQTKLQPSICSSVIDRSSDPSEAKIVMRWYLQSITMIIMIIMISWVWKTRFKFQVIFVQTIILCMKDFQFGLENIRFSPTCLWIIIYYEQASVRSRVRLHIMSSSWMHSQTYCPIPLPPIPSKPRDILLRCQKLNKLQRNERA